jgi:hypothetical protein
MRPRINHTRVSPQPKDRTVEHSHNREVPNHSNKPYYINIGTSRMYITEAERITYSKFSVKIHKV